VEQFLGIAGIVKGKERGIVIPSLLFHLAKINRTPQQSWRSPGLESAKFDPEFGKAA
jgi:hypothetical protein